MKGSASKICLTPLEDIFRTEESGEEVREVPLTELFTFKDHPFRVLDDDKMQELVESIQQYGVLVPGLVRPREAGGYELIAGHRRKHGCELAGLKAMPVIIRTLDDDAATIAMVDSNFQREKLLPSEKAFAYRMKLEAMNHQGVRTDLSYSQSGNKTDRRTSSQILAEQTGESKNRIFRFIRLTYLNQTLRDMVDDGDLAFIAAVALSYLTESEQEILITVMNRLECIPSVGQAGRLKERSKDNGLSPDYITAVLSEEKPLSDKITLKGEKLRAYFPKEYSTQQMEETIFELLKRGKRNNCKQHLKSNTSKITNI